MPWSLPEPMLAAPVDGPYLPEGWAAEPKWDGYRALIRHAGGRAEIRSRRGTDMTAAFPEIAAAVDHLPDDVGLDGELVVWHNGRLAFELLQGRLIRTAATAARLARERPAHFVAFDLLHRGPTDLTTQAYAQRRAALEDLFITSGLGPPWTLCPSSTDPVTAAQWLTWSSVGMEGLVFKDTGQPYLAGRRAWRKYRTRASTEALVGAITGTLAAPDAVLLGRLDDAGAFQLTGRTTALSPTASRVLAARLTPAGGTHPWTGWTFRAGWGSRELLQVSLVEPELVGEVSADVVMDAAGRWRHAVRWIRLREDVTPADVPRFSAGNRPASA